MEGKLTRPHFSSRGRPVSRVRSAGITSHTTTASPRQPPGSRLHVETDVATPTAASPGSPRARSLVSSFAMSGLLHIALLIVASLIMLGQFTPDPLNPMTAGFELDSQAEAFSLSPELLTVEISPPSPTLSALASMESGAPAVDAAGEIDFDFSAYGTGQGAAVDGANEIAQGIQDRVRQAGGAAGEVQFSLAWHTTNDLDLHVITPSGEHLSYRHRKSRCDGFLDVDMNVQPESTEPVENVRWLDRSAPMGRYTILVHLYQWRNGQFRDDWELLAQLGTETQVISHSVSSNARISVQRFHYVRSSISAARRKQLLNQMQTLQTREEDQAGALLEKALQQKSASLKEQMLMKIINQFAHTDASIRAMQYLESVPK